MGVIACMIVDLDVRPIYVIIQRIRDPRNHSNIKTMNYLL